MLHTGSTRSMARAADHIGLPTTTQHRLLFLFDETDWSVYVLHGLGLHLLGVQGADGHSHRSGQTEVCPRDFLAARAGTRAAPLERLYGTFRCFGRPSGHRIENRCSGTWVSSALRRYSIWVSSGESEKAAFGSIPSRHLNRGIWPLQGLPGHGIGGGHVLRLT